MPQFEYRLRYARKVVKNTITAVNFRAAFRYAAHLADPDGERCLGVSVKAAPTPMPFPMSNN
ncbi:hypothetical protein [Runella salmonicolor]|uniref:Uncharacterized protein n=1 Tax=Runella salmonicolor TaxID=2950278 RepID=A0ABT1FRS7_9BACT|nr:hypothetical protein [Runella salmonicolor]MCP1384475.1 hypothetical protein [Runella salmonicolor]